MKDAPAFDPPTASTIRCPSCGASASETDRACAFCGSLLATRRCAACFTLSPRDAVKCTRCGADLPSDVLSVSAAGKPCPDCGVPLVGRKTGVLGYAECARCGGLYLSNQVFQTVVEGADARATARAVEGEDPPDTETFPKSFHYRKCPFCAGLMARRNYGAGSGVILDVCRKDGVFLDRGELTAVVKFLEGGGWEKVRKRERERLSEEVSALESRRHALSTGTFPIAAPEGGEMLAGLLGWLGSVLGRRIR